MTACDVDGGFHNKTRFVAFGDACCGGNSKNIRSLGLSNFGQHPATISSEIATKPLIADGDEVSVDGAPGHPLSHPAVSKL